MDPKKKRERLQRFEEWCRQHRLPLTVQRRAILETVLDRIDHPTADAVYDEVKNHIPGVSRTTVYRVLEKLVEIGMITKACSPRAATRFDPITHRHHHLVCLHCDRLIDLEDERLGQRIKLPDVRPYSFEIKDFSVHFNGICAACRRELRSKGSASAYRLSRARKRTTGNKKKESRKRKVR